MRPAFVLGYFVGVVALVVGVMILTGYLHFRGMEDTDSSMLRIVAGIVALLYGVYRLVATEAQRKREARLR